MQPGLTESMCIRLSLCVLGLLLGPGTVKAELPLFAENTVMTLSIALDFKDLCRPRESENCDFVPTVLVYGTRSGEKRSMPVEIKARGGWRSLSRNCSAPLLWVRFDEQAVPGTPFEGQTLLPLTTHCGKGVSVEALTRAIPRADFEQYLLREFLAYRIYSTLTDLSLRTRLVRISYPDPGQMGRSTLHYAFFTEHFDAAAARTGNERPERGNFDPGRLALFQFMIGNTDWSIARERNTMLLQSNEGKQLPVPYDMDMSGLVNADYAGPAPGLPIDDVRERYFLGFCQPGVDWATLFAEFNHKREHILELDDLLPGLSRSSQRWIHRYLESFFDLLDSADQRREQITAACRPWPPSPADYATPLDD
jgi:hypothetical protein